MSQEKPPKDLPPIPFHDASEGRLQSLRDAALRDEAPVMERVTDDVEPAERARREARNREREQDPKLTELRNMATTKQKKKDLLDQLREGAAD